MEVRTVDSGEILCSLGVDGIGSQAVGGGSPHPCLDAFGTRVQSESVLSISDVNGEVDEAFTELNVSEVQGEWMQTLEVI